MDGSGSRLTFLLLLFSLCAWFGRGIFQAFGIHALSWLILAGACMLTFVHVITRMSTTFKAMNRDVTPLASTFSRDQNICMLHLVATLIVFAVMLTVAITSHLMNNIPLREWENVIKMAFGIGTFLAVQLTITNRRLATIVFWVIIFSVCASSLYALYQVTEIPHTEYASRARVAGLSGHIVFFSFHLALALPMTLALSLYSLCQRCWWQSIMLLAMLLVLLFAMESNATRGVVLGSIISFALIATLFAFHRYLGIFARVCILLGISIMPPCVLVGGNLIISALKKEADEMMLLERKGPDKQEDLFASMRRRIFNISNLTAMSRIWQCKMTLRYFLQNGKFWGTAVAAEKTLTTLTNKELARLFKESTGKELGKDLEWDYLLTRVIKANPHNQFCAMLSIYNIAGLTLLLAFYLIVAGCGIHLWNLAMKQKDIGSVFLVASVSGALLSSFISWNFCPCGLFVGHHWSSYFIVGLMFATQRILVREQTATIYTGHARPRRASTLW